MSRIKKTFASIGKKGGKAFIPYVTAGDPDLDTSLNIVKTLAREGADIIEIGIPFSDPLADGPTIQKAIKRSLDAGCRVKDAFALTRELRKTVDLPVVYMTYYNILYSFGVERFVKAAKKAGSDGVIVPDLPLEESRELSFYAKKEGYDVIMLAAPTTPIERFRKICRASSGFVYYISLTGVTGARKVLSSGLKKRLRELRDVSTLPLCVGFGVSSPKQAGDMADMADGVIVGSSIIKIIERNVGDKAVMMGRIERFVGSVSRAIHKSGKPDR